MVAPEHFLTSFVLIISFVFFHSSANALFNGQPYTGSSSQIQELQQIASASRAQIANAPISIPASNATSSVHKHDNTSDSTIASARAVVASAIAQQRAINKARIQSPLRNTYTSRHASSTKQSAANVQPMVLPDTIVAAAAALIAEVDAAAKFKNGTLYKDYSSILTLGHRSKGVANVTKRQTTSFWMEGVAHLGTQPLGGNSSYKVSQRRRISSNILKSEQVWRSVKDYGAVGDGVTVSSLTERTLQENFCSNIILLIRMTLRL
jgi:hypothetical protein